MKRKAKPPPTASKGLLVAAIVAGALVVVGVVVLLVLNSGDADNPDAPGGPGALKGLPVGQWESAEVLYDLNTDGTFRWKYKVIPDDRMAHTGTVTHYAENRFLLTGNKDHFRPCHEMYPQGSELVVVVLGTNRQEKRPNETSRVGRYIFRRVGAASPPPADGRALLAKLAGTWLDGDAEWRVGADGTIERDFEGPMRLTPGGSRALLAQVHDVTWEWEVYFHGDLARVFQFKRGEKREQAETNRSWRLRKAPAGYATDGPVDSQPAEWMAGKWVSDRGRPTETAWELTADGKWSSVSRAKGEKKSGTYRRDKAGWMTLFERIGKVDAPTQYRLSFTRRKMAWQHNPPQGLESLTALYPLRVFVRVTP
jgi:hypothetical protein